MLRVTNLRKDFRSQDSIVRAVKDVSFEIPQGEFFTLLGPSGCGKSTTLRCIAGLEAISGGEIAIDDRVVASDSVYLDADRRPIAMVFQSYAIWPHMTVLGNVTFPLSYRGGEDGKGMPRKERHERGMEALRLVQLEHLAKRDAPYLSGGQQQRVALARALVVRPKLLLLDEPLSNLDAKLREEMRSEIKQLTNMLGISTLYVTHDQGEALSMSDQIAVMADGEILQVGSPRDIYLHPMSTQVARTVGNVNTLHGEIRRNGADDRIVEVELASGQLVHCRASGSPESVKVSVMFRPELVTPRRKGEQGEKRTGQEDLYNVIPAVVQSVVFTGDHVQCTYQTSDGVVASKSPPDLDLDTGEDVELLVKIDRCTAGEAADDSPRRDPSTNYFEQVRPGS